MTLIPTAYQTPDRKLTIVAVKFHDGNPISWVIYRTGDSSEVLNYRGIWEPQPQPSDRSAEFIARTRFATIDDAIKAIEVNVI